MKTPTLHHKGFVILFTILISTIILMIGLGIFSIATRETILSSTAREAQYAFYAADAGVECALYAQSLPLGGPLSLNGGDFECGAITPTVSVSGNGTATTPFEFFMLVDEDVKTCAHVTIFDLGNMRRIIAQGYNICGPDGKPLTKNPILVERDLDTTYELGGNDNGALLPDKPATVKNPGSLGNVPSGALVDVIPVTP